MDAAISIVRRMSPYGPGSRLIDSGTHHRYISSIWADCSGAYIITGRAGERRYIGYSLKEAMLNYNSLCR